MLDVEGQSASPYRSAPRIFRAFVEYRQPGFNELDREFVFVDPHYEQLPSRLDARYAEISKENREIDFEFVLMIGGTSGRWITQEVFELMPVCDKLAFMSRPVEATSHVAGVGREGIIGEIQRRHLRPAIFAELLSFARKFAHLSWRYPIVALGSIAHFDGSVICPKVDLRNGYRLPFFWHKTSNLHHIFLAVRES